MSEHTASAEQMSLRAKIQELLRTEYSKSMAGAVGLFFTGLAVSAVMGIVVATVIWFALNSLAGKTLIGWFGWFIVYWAVLVPLLIWHERRSRTDYVVEALSSKDPHASSHSEKEWDQARVQSRVRVAQLAGSLTWGPRALLDGVSGLRGKWTPRQNHMFRRAARLVLDLAKYDGGIEIRALLHPPEDMQSFMAAVDWLDKANWLGKSTDGQRLWLSTPARQKLVANHLTPHSRVEVIK
jgi:hypothetical protein